MLKTIEMIEIEGKSYEVIKFNEIDQEKYCGFIYITINKLDGKKYVGKKSWTEGGSKWYHPENYLGSGIRLNRAINKYGRENFIRYIIDLAESKDELTKKETFYINEEFNATVPGNNWYNISGGSGGGDVYIGRTDEEMRELGKKMSENSMVSKAIVIFKNNEYLNEFNSIRSAAITLEQAIGGNLGNGLSSMVNDNWIPGSGRLKGYSAMYKEDYKKLQEGQLKRSETVLGKTSKSRKGKSIVIFKNNEYLNTFSSIISAASKLEQAIGGKKGSISRGFSSMVNDNWIPKYGRLKGYSAMYLEDYEKRQEDQLQIIS